MLKNQRMGEQSGKYINCEECGTPRYFYRYLKACGFKMIRLSEEEIKTGKFKERMVF